MKKQYIIALLGMIFLISACRASVPPVQDVVPGNNLRPDEESIEVGDASGSTPEPLVNLEWMKAESQEPAAGICAEDRSSVVLVEIGTENPPSPRCMIVYTESVLIFKNATRSRVDIELAGNTYMLDPGVEQGVNRSVGEYMEKGVHRVKVDGGFLPEIWIK
jgi:hypothetical protein